MICRADAIRKFALLTFLSIMTALPVYALEERIEISADEEAAPLAIQPEEPAEAQEVLTEEEPPTEAGIETRTAADAFAGYRFLGTDSFDGRAAEYEYIRSNPTLGAGLNSLGSNLKLALDGAFLNDRDYHGDLLVDYRGEYRFHLRTESLFHNLDNLTPILITVSGNDPTARFGIKAEQDLARFRYKLHGYPVHINLGYWRIVKEGDTQLRYADNNFTAWKSKSRRIDRQTHEGDIGFDTHLGPVDIIYSFKIREFDDSVAVPRDDFTAGTLQHNEDPESRYYAHTVKLHTSLTGGIVGAASYTYGRRENRSSLTDIKGADRTRDTLHNAAGDFVYTPCKEFSLALKYRRQEIDRDNPSSIEMVLPSPTPELNVRPAVDTQKDIVSATLSVRPTNLLSFKGEYKGEFLHRDNLSLWNQPDKAVSKNLPENSDSHKGIFTILSRPVKGLRIKAQYSYATTSHPSYGNSYEEKHEGQLLATYTLLNKWGVTANGRITQESNGQIAMTTLPLFGNIPETYQLPRDKKAVNAILTLWVTPIERLTVTGSYGLLRSRTDQAVIFAAITSGSQDATNFTTQAQIYAINAVYHLDERLDLSLALQQVRSLSEFDPEFKAIGGGDTSRIKEISRIKTLESSVSARGDYHLARNFSVSLDYTYRDYDNKVSSLFEGAVHTVTLYLAKKW